MVKTIVASLLLVTGSSLFVGYLNVKLMAENKAYKEREEAVAAAIEECSAKNNVHLASCQMKAVVVTPREEPAPDKTADLLPFPVGMKG